jgi:allantoicase
MTASSSFSELVDLAAERLGGAVIAANDEFFAPKESLLRPSAPEWREGEYTDRGKWMDGWETRRRRTPGYDWCLIRLGVPGVVRGVVVDTSFFRGNFPESCSVEGCDVEGIRPPEQLLDQSVEWVELVEKTKLKGDTRNEIAVKSDVRVTHLRLNIFPDGGVARLRVHGEARPRWELMGGGPVDLASAEHGGRVLAASDMFFGHRHNLIMPGRSTHMGDGWETKRRRGPGHDWLVLQLGAPGVIERVEVDTDHYKGNAPASCMVESVDAGGDSDVSVETLTDKWRPLLALTTLQPHARHIFANELQKAGRSTHVRLSIYPDGGIARLRLFGVPEMART